VPTAKLRQDTVKALPYVGNADREEQCIYWDETLPCFGLRVRPTGRLRAGGRRNYVCSYRVQGRKRLATLGRANVLTLDQARRKARAYLGQVAAGKDPQAADDVLYASGTIKELAETYLTQHAMARKRSWRNDESYLQVHVLPKLATRLAGSVTSSDIGDLHAQIGKENPYTANRVLEVVRKMFNCARAWKKIPKDAVNPATGIEKFREFKRKVFVTSDQFPALARALNAEEGEFARHALWLLLLTGVRLNELLKAQWSDVDWTQRTLSLGRTKNDEPVLAPLSHAAIARLKAIPRLNANPYIICGKLPGQHLKNLRSAWIRVRAAAGLTNLRMHDLRRTVGSWLVRDGASLHLVGAVLNHKDQKTTAGYAYFQTQDRQAALDRHGEKIIDISTQAMAASRGDAEASADQVHSAPAAALGTLCFTRQQLYDLVWSEPVAKLAAGYGISDVGLAKACRRAGIPVPERGYWTKVASGQRVKKRSLPPCALGIDDRIKIKRRLRHDPSRFAAELRTTDHPIVPGVSNERDTVACS